MINCEKNVEMSQKLTKKVIKIVIVSQIRSLFPKKKVKNKKKVFKINKINILEQ